MEQLNVKEYVKQEKEKLRKAARVAPSLLIIDATAGDIGNQIYIRNKVKDFNEMGWTAVVRKVEDSAELRFCLDTAFERGFTSVIVQMPVADEIHFLPDMIPYSMDCDGLNSHTLVLPATVRGVVDYLDACGFEYRGKNAVVLGRSNIVGKPMAKELLKRDMTVSVCHSATDLNFRNYLLDKADLVVSAVGKPRLFSRDHCFRAIVVDVGINRGEDGKITGDFVESPYIDSLPGVWSTPVPGGVGLLTRLGLMKNCVELTNLLY